MTDEPGIRLDDLVDAAITKAALRDIGLLGKTRGRGGLSLTIDKTGALEIVERDESGIAVCAWGAAPQVTEKLIRRLQELKQERRTG